MRGFFCIRNGKCSKIRIVGSTISSIQGKITTKADRIELPMIPIGLYMPILIPFSLTNIGMTPLKYSLDFEEFKKSHPHIHEKGVIQFENTQNNMMPGEKKYLRVFYRPCEIRDYSCRFSIRVSDYFKDIQTLVVWVRGKPVQNFDPAMLNAYFKVDDQLHKEPFLFTEQEDLAYLNDDLLDFRNAEMNKTSEKIVLLHNFSGQNQFNFKFTDLQFSRCSNQFRKYYFFPQDRHPPTQAVGHHQSDPRPKGTVLHFRDGGQVRDLLGV